MYSSNMEGTAKSNRKDKPPKPVLDKKDEAIIHCLEQNPDILLKQISDTLKRSGGLNEEIPYPTLQRRMNRLIKDKVVGRAYAVNWMAAGYMVRYRVGILINPVELRDKTIEGKNYDSQEALAKYIMQVLAKEKPFINELVIDDVFILLGGNVDLAVDFYAKDDKTATRFIINRLRRLPGISNTVSAKLAYSSKHGYLSQNGNDDDGEIQEGI